MWIRFVLVPGLSDNTAEIEELAQFIQTLSTVEKVEVLPFHKMGEYKWQDLGYPYRLSQTNEPEQKQVEEAKAIFARYGLATN